jgi:DedD protein
MPFFKSRKGGDESAATPRQPESIEAMRRRARHRLIGAGVLVLIGVVGFPLLFDTQPRPIAVDIPIEIPDRNKVKPLPVPAQPAVQAPTVSGPVTSPPAPEKVAEAPAKAEAKPEAKPEAIPEPKPEPKLEPKPEPKPEPKVAAKPEAPADNGTRAKALLEGKPVKVATAAEGRFVVQVGAFADVAKARDARQKVERAGLKTYTNVAETKDGKRIRVRVGPFASRAEADKAADRIKGLDLPAAILTL